MVIVSELEEEKREIYYLIGIKFQFCKMEGFWKWRVAMVTQ